ncbi:MAG TPA: trypsin-like peptidase domain-containing protein [Gaiellaceae bacterium]|nr:trypsin-like peptidase domain-containing protein [Gaiellaceae bacterium]
MRKYVVPFAALLAAAVLGAVAGVGLWEAVDDEATPAAATSTTVANRPVAASTGSVAELYEQTIPGVVEITAASGSQGFPFGGQGQASTGSGWVLNAEGYVVTNQHVIDGADEVTVKFHDGEEVSADVVGADASTDVALLKLDEVPDDLQPLDLGSSESLRIGDPVVAIGSPFGLEGTVTSGIVSAKDRQLTAPDGFTIDGAIQTDAALNQGNSGGPLLDAEGRVVGMNSQIASQSGGNVGVGYAVPVETIQRVVDQLQSGGTVEYAYLGVELGDAEDGGAQIGAVRSGSPADDAGLRAGDVVVKADGEDVDGGDDLRRAVADREPGDELELEVRRDGDTETLTVTLGTRPTS